jgi:hypothetical protein
MPSGTRTARRSGNDRRHCRRSSTDVNDLKKGVGHLTVVRPCPPTKLLDAPQPCILIAVTTHPLASWLWHAGPRPALPAVTLTWLGDTPRLKH